MLIPITEGIHLCSCMTLERMSSANRASFNDPRLISTLAKAPTMAALARDEATVRSEAMLGLVIGFRVSTMSLTSRALCAVSMGTLVAPFMAFSMAASPSLEVLASLYAANT